VKGRRHEAQAVEVSERKARRPVLVVAAMVDVLRVLRVLLAGGPAIAGDDVRDGRRSRPNFFCQARAFRNI
jgi:predicted lipoprotein